MKQASLSGGQPGSVCTEPSIGSPPVGVNVASVKNSSKQTPPGVVGASPISGAQQPMKLGGCWTLERSMTTTPSNVSIVSLPLPEIIPFFTLSIPLDDE